MAENKQDLQGHKQACACGGSCGGSTCGSRCACRRRQEEKGGEEQ